MKAITDIIDEQVKATGISVVRVDDGHVFTFSEALLEQMLNLARIKGEVVLFIHESVHQVSTDGAQA